MPQQVDVNLQDVVEIYSFRKGQQIEAILVPTKVYSEEDGSEVETYPEVWRRTISVELLPDTSSITAFYYMLYTSVKFTANYRMSQVMRNSIPIKWSITGLPSGLTASIDNSISGGITVSGRVTTLNQESDVTVSLEAGELSESKVYRFVTGSDGKSIKITSTATSFWENGRSGPVSGTSSISISSTGGVTGTTTYYVNNRPSWMSYNSSTGQLTGTPSSYEATSGTLSVYATKGSYLTPTVSIPWRAGNYIPRLRQSSISFSVGVSTANSSQPLGTLLTSKDFNTLLYPLESGVAVSWSCSKTYEGHVYVGFSGSTFRITKKSRCTSTNVHTYNMTCTASTKHGSATINVSITC